MSTSHPYHSRNRLPPLNAVRTFEVAAKHGSFLKAASELHVTAGAVSRSVKSLEEYLGIELFRRSHRTVELTMEATAYAEIIAQALDQISDATAKLTLLNKQKALRICCHLTFAIHWLIPRLWKFNSIHSEYEIELCTNISPEVASPDEFDFIVRLGTYDNNHEKYGEMSAKIVDFNVFPVCSKNFLTKNSWLTQPNDLCHFSLIQSARRPNDWDYWLEAVGLKGNAMSNRTSFESLTHVHSAALAGAGVAIGINAFMNEELKSGQLIKLFKHTYNDPRGLHLIYKNNQVNRLQKMDHFLEWITDSETKSEI